MKLIQRNIASPCILYHRADIQSQSNPHHSQCQDSAQLQRDSGSSLWAAAEPLCRYIPQFVLPQLPNYSITKDCHIREDTQISALPYALKRTQLDCRGKPSL